MTRKADPAVVGAAVRRYQRRFAVAITAYVLALVLAIFLLRRIGAAPALVRYGLAVLPALPILGVVWALGRLLVEETDEVIRARVIHQLLWGGAFALSVSTIWGFLEALAGAPHLPAYWVFPAFCLGTMLVTPFVRRMYS